MAYQTRQGLPDGWVAQWDPRYERYFYVDEKASKPQPQWECPVPNLNIPPPPSKEHSAPPTEPPPPYAHPTTGGPSPSPAASGSGDRGIFSRLHHGHQNNQQPYYGGQPGYGGYPPYGAGPGPGYAAGPPGPGYGYAPAAGYGGRSGRFGGGGGGLLSNPMVTGLGGLAAGGLAMHAFDDAFDHNDTVVENNYYGDDGYDGGGGDFGGGDYDNNDFDGGFF
ncbi:fungal protein [Schizosaccharomyces cryophilus OY26]|uniref:Fungal protein n=1 Tax=Schizosaccharomyces cryophilus (strain OY26 / ATCC MYA-4695 / CBS 11777 / NBRC 106824 / NRRL Y48691) TaxID=653667 RepID=S9X5Z2_SCHCR|nr:uncharacterized protein SPOG_04435 [Schizosaccharomyces cryophilus OY26]EPY49211.1 fungal protein [Schizosaccharomyces cryophilus OY26]